MLTDETEARLGQVRPFEDGVEDVLSFAVQLIHLIQNKKSRRKGRHSQPPLLFSHPPSRVMSVILSRSLKKNLNCRGVIHALFYFAKSRRSSRFLNSLHHQMKID